MGRKGRNRDMYKPRYLFHKEIFSLPIPSPRILFFPDISLWCPLMLITSGYHFVCVCVCACVSACVSACVRVCDMSQSRWIVVQHDMKTSHSEAPIHGMAWLFRGVPDSWDSWQRLKAKRSRMRKPTGRHRSDGSSASDSPRATYARVLVRSLARLIIQLISPGRSPHLRFAPASYELRVLHTLNKLRRICSECNPWYSRALKRVA